MIIYTITFIYFIFFMFVYLQDRRRLLNGFLFFVLLVLLGLSLVTLFDMTKSSILFIFILGFAFITIFMVILGGILIMISSLINSIVLIKREGFSFTNLLSLFLAIGIFLWMILSQLTFSNIQFNNIFSTFMVSVNMILFYIIFMFTNFLLSSFIYQFYYPVLKHDYIIVLGSGLMNGSDISPLLASRIDKAIYLYDRQLEKKKDPMKIIMSGGQGIDEALPEAMAMKAYALRQGISSEDILVEGQSKNTCENMLYSKRLIEDRENDIKKVRILFSTSNYHVFRAGIYARIARLNAQGVGAKTKLYFWYNAMLREFVAIIMMNKVFHITLMGLMLLIFYSVLYFLNHPDMVQRLVGLIT